MEKLDISGSIGRDDGFARNAIFLKNGSFNLLKSTERGYWVNFNKKGGASEKSWKRAEYYIHPVTWLRQCDRCRKISTPKKICERWDVAYFYAEIGEEWPDIKNKIALCMGCWNKIRPTIKAHKNYIETRRLINKLKKEITQCQKSKHRAI